MLHLLEQIVFWSSLATILLPSEEVLGQVLPPKALLWYHVLREIITHYAALNLQQEAVQLYKGAVKPPEGK